MEKTKLGFSTNLMAAIIYFAALFSLFSGGFLYVLPFILLVAYSLKNESSLWLKSSALKAAFVIILFEAVYVILSFIPDIFELFNFFLKMIPGFSFRLKTSFTPATETIDFLDYLQMILFAIEKLVLLLLAFFAFNGKTIKLPFIDNTLQKHVN